MSVQEEIKKLVDKYTFGNNKELFKAELEYLVAVAEKEQMKKDYKDTRKLLTQIER
jgi:hypothetical protein